MGQFYPYMIFKLTRGETWGLKRDEKLVAPSAISDKRVVRMKLTDSCVLGREVREKKLDFQQNQMDTEVE